MPITQMENEDLQDELSICYETIDDLTKENIMLKKKLKNSTAQNQISLQYEISKELNSENADLKREIEELQKENEKMKNIVHYDHNCNKGWCDAPEEDKDQDSIPNQELLPENRRF